ncbi:aminoacyl-tRNA deacylase and HDOD domain-containing protein [Agaribacterium haliotis]|uniref:aminoacyl-tRNA deacylase and HDOD domain-containing protein n=1 Tax=Agaribacterium haliotis TaxID=2013869 RepID=UPI000BB54DBA|nr:HDOD domain-containing protein [Agaribacterium haliotis]
MAVSQKILDLLQDKQNVSFTITEKPPTSEALSIVPKDETSCLVKGLILKDNQNQQVQVLVPQHNIVDLDAMFRHFGRQFEGVATHEVWSLINAKELHSVPAIPQWQNLPTFIDESLLKKDELLLDSGDSHQLVKLNHDSFINMAEPCEVGNFSSPAPDVSGDASNDEAQILDSVKRFTERRIRQRLDETLELPPLPDTAQRIIKLRADPNADINDLTNIVEIDPSLAAQVVSWAASPYYSAPGKIKSVHDAIVRVLGFDMVLNLALGLALGKTLSMKVLTKNDIDEYWRNAVYTAATVEGLVTSISREYRPGFGMAYLSGLLNNFGSLVVAEIFPPYYQLLNRARAANPHVHPAAVEQHTLGVSGNQIASWLLENWNMPNEVVVALRQQSNARFKGEHASYARLNYVAKQLLANKGFGDMLPAKIDADIFDALNLSEDSAQSTVDNILESGDDLDAIAEKMRG